MADFILLMHADAVAPVDEEAWGDYLARLQAEGRLRGGSAIGGGVCVRKAGDLPPTTRHLTGFIRVSADDPAQAQALVAGNPVFEAGGTVEIRELPGTD